MKSKIPYILKQIGKGIGIAILIYLLVAPIWVYIYGRRSVYTQIENVAEHEIAIVLGAGVTPEGEPRDMLQDRLDLAADLYEAGEIKRILVTGDNREQNYNEPAVMFNYLINERNIPEDDIILDYAGRRTYDSCARANEVFEIDDVILISQGYHLPRAIFLCENLGVNATGLSATLHNEYEGEFYYKVREFFALHKAIWDVYIWEPDYVSGDVINIEE
jgi:vancomycin permeability regulator SanA